MTCRLLVVAVLVCVGVASDLFAAAATAALDELYVATAGATWYNRRGWENTTAKGGSNGGSGGSGGDLVCDRFGIECDAGGRVTSLALSSNNLNGTLGASYFVRHRAFWSRLAELRLSNNPWLRGPLPSFASDDAAAADDADNSGDGGYRENLRYISFAGCGFSGGAERQFGDLRRLESLHLNRNFLSGPPPPLDRLPALAVAQLNSNAFSGALCLNLSAASRVVLLDVSRNRLGGAFCFGLAPSLVTVALNRNNFSSLVFDASSSGAPALARLTVLDLSRNAHLRVAANLSEWFVHAPVLQQLDLSGTGDTLPHWLRAFDQMSAADGGGDERHLGSLRELRLRRVGGAGRRPSVAENVADTDASSTVPMPTRAPVSTRLAVLDLSANALVASFYELAYERLSKWFPNAVLLDLSANRLSVADAIPCGASMPAALKRLDVSDNDLAGDDDFLQIVWPTFVYNSSAASANAVSAKMFAYPSPPPPPPPPRSGSMATTTTTTTPTSVGSGNFLVSRSGDRRRNDAVAKSSAGRVLCQFAPGGPSLDYLDLSGNPRLEPSTFLRVLVVAADATERVYDAATGLVCPAWRHEYSSFTLVASPQFFNFSGCVCRNVTHYWARDAARCAPCPDQGYVCRPYADGLAAAAAGDASIVVKIGYYPVEHPFAHVHAKNRTADATTTMTTPAKTIECAAPWHCNPRQRAVFECGVGRDRDSLLCSLCAADWYAFDGDCRPCLAARTTRAFAVFFWLLCAALILVFARFTSYRGQRDNHVTTAVFWFQLTNALRAISYWRRVDGGGGADHASLSSSGNTFGRLLPVDLVASFSPWAIECVFPAAWRGESLYYGAYAMLACAAIGSWTFLALRQRCFSSSVSALDEALAEFSGDDSGDGDSDSGGRDDGGGSGGRDDGGGSGGRDDGDGGGSGAGDRKREAEDGPSRGLTNDRVHGASVRLDRDIFTATTTTGFVLMADDDTDDRAERSDDDTDDYRPEARLVQESSSLRSVSASSPRSAHSSPSRTAPRDGGKRTKVTGGASQLASPPPPPPPPPPVSSTFIFGMRLEPNLHALPRLADLPEPPPPATKRSKVDGDTKRAATATVVAVREPIEARLAEETRPPLPSPRRDKTCGVALEFLACYLLDSLYFPVAMASLQLLTCSHSQWYVTGAPYVSCTTAQYHAYYGFAVVVVLLYLVCGPAALWFRVRRVRLDLVRRGASVDGDADGNGDADGDAEAAVAADPAERSAAIGGVGINRERQHSSSAAASDELDAVTPTLVLRPSAPFSETHAATRSRFERWRARENWRQREVWGFLWAPLTARYWWWKIVAHSVRKLALAAILTLIDPRSIYMPVAAFSLLLALVILQIHLRPFARLTQNVTDVGVLAVACALYLVFILANVDTRLSSSAGAARLIVTENNDGGGGGGGAGDPSEPDEFLPRTSSAPSMLAAADWIQGLVSTFLVARVLHRPLVQLRKWMHTRPCGSGCRGRPQCCWTWSR